MNLIILLPHFLIFFHIFLKHFLNLTILGGSKEIDEIVNKLKCCFSKIIDKMVNGFDIKTVFSIVQNTFVIENIVSTNAFVPRISK